MRARPGELWRIAPETAAPETTALLPHSSWQWSFDHGVNLQGGQEDAYNGGRTARLYLVPRTFPTPGIITPNDLFILWILNHPQQTVAEPVRAVCGTYLAVISAVWLIGLL